MEPKAIDEVLRTFSGEIEQTAPLTRKKIRTLVVALGGTKSIGPMAQKLMASVAENADGATVECSHFIPEEKPEEEVRWIARFLPRWQLASGPTSKIAG